MATICEELPPESLMLIYLSASGYFGLHLAANIQMTIYLIFPHCVSCTGKGGQGNVSQTDSSGESKKSSKNKVVVGISSEKNSNATNSHSNGKLESVDYHDTYLWLGPRGINGECANTFFLLCQSDRMMYCY